MDEKRIRAVLDLNIIHANNMQIKYILEKLKPEALLNANNDMLLERQNYDPKDQFLRFLEHTNPTYTAVAFVGNETKVKTKPKIMRNLDPIRRSFAISKFAKEL